MWKTLRVWGVQFASMQRRTVSSSSSSDLARANMSHCVELVKKHDFENYLIGALHMPRKYRPSFFAIHSFNVEISLIQSQVRGNAAAARLRYKWWLDTLNSIYSSLSSQSDMLETQEDSLISNPVLYCLCKSIREHNLSQRWLERVIEAKMRELNSIQVENLSEMEDHCEKSHSSLLYLLLESMNIQHEKTEHMASHIGVCFGFVSRIRGTALFLSQNINPFPKESVANCQLDANYFRVLNSSGMCLDGLPEAQRVAFREVVFDVASQAYGHLDKARSLQSSIVENSIYVMLPGLICSSYLERLNKSDFNPLRRDMIEPDRSAAAMLQMKMIKSSWTNTI